MWGRVAKRKMWESLGCLAAILVVIVIVSILLKVLVKPIGNNGEYSYDINGDKDFKRKYKKEDINEDNTPRNIGQVNYNGPRAYGVKVDALISNDSNKYVYKPRPSSSAVTSMVLGIISIIIQFIIFSIAIVYVLSVMIIQLFLQI